MIRNAQIRTMFESIHLKKLNLLSSFLTRSIHGISAPFYSRSVNPRPIFSGYRQTGICVHVRLEP